jgi:hypothetical protein
VTRSLPDDAGTTADDRSRGVDDDGSADDRAGDVDDGESSDDRSGEVDTATDADGFRSDLVEGVRAVDVAVLCVVPAVLVAVLALPVGLRRSLAFAYTDPTLPTAFTAHYVHLRATHLAGNLVGYGLLAGVGYALAVLGGRRRLFLTALATFLLAFPLALSALNLAVPRNALGFGFSGINMALLGLLPLLLWAYARERFALDASVRALPAVFFLLVGWIALLALPVSTTGAGVAGLATAGAGVSIGAVYAMSTDGGVRLPTRDRLRAVTSRPGYGDLFVVGSVLLVGYPVVGFPADPTATGQVVNLYVHLLGFCLGFIGAFVLLAGDVVDE